MLKWLSKGLSIALLLLPLSISAETAEEKGLAISTEADKRNNGWGDSSNDLQMILRNAQGEESKRSIRLKTLEVANDGDKSLSVFNRPRDVKGTAFLNFTHAIEADDQWLYLPALKRVKRISSANKSGPFMGSELAFEDLSSQELAKYNYKWLRDELLEGRDTFVIELYPQYKHSGYKHLVTWLDKIMYQSLKVVYYDRKDALLKTLTFHDYSQYLGQYWRPARQEMVNHQNGKSTTLLWTNYQFKTGLTEQDFNRNSLKRGR